MRNLLMPAFAARTMRLFQIKPLIFLCALMSTSTWAAEELSVDKLMLQAQIENHGHRVEFGADSAWLAGSSHVTRVAAADNSVVDIRIEGNSGYFQGPAFGEGGFWIAAPSLAMIFKVDPSTNTIALKIPAQMVGFRGSIGVGEGSVWVITVGEGPTLTRFSASTGAEEAAIKLPSSGNGVRADYGSVWVTGESADVLYQVDPKSNEVVATIPTGRNPRYLTSGEGSIWTLNHTDGSVTRIDGYTAAVLANIDAGLRGPGGGIASGGGYVWVTRDKIRVAQIDPKTNALIRSFSSEIGPGTDSTIAYGAGSLWVSSGMAGGLQRFEAPK